MHLNSLYYLIIFEFSSQYYLYYHFYPFFYNKIINIYFMKIKLHHNIYNKTQQTFIIFNIKYTKKNIQ